MNSPIHKILLAALAATAIALGAQALEQDTDGYYMLGSVQDWQDFATLIKTTPTANAKMIADIDLGDDQTHIGSIYENSRDGDDYAVIFKGIFDGQGHTLTVAYVGSGKQMVAPFDKIEGATIKNLHVAGTIQATFAYLGVVGWAGGTSLVSNVWMSAVITNSFGGWGHTGSMVGGISGNQSLTIADCLFTGSLTCRTSYTGCFLGNTYNGNAVINNCLSVGTVNIGGGFSGTHYNCYVKQCSVAIPAAMQVTDEQLADGTTAAALQAGREELVWEQNSAVGHPMLRIFGEKETITWLNDEGTEIDTTEVINGSVPVHADPTKAAAAPYRWVFTGWSPELEPAVSNTTYTATFRKIADLSLCANDWTAADGDEIVGETAHEVTVPAGAHVTLNGIAVNAGGSGTPAPAFSGGGAAEATAFGPSEGGTWTLEAYGELANDALGRDVSDGMVHVYASDTVEGLATARPMEGGVEIKDRKSAVKVTLEVTPPTASETQFFRVEFGD